MYCLVDHCCLLLCLYLCSQISSFDWYLLQSRQTIICMHTKMESTIVGTGQRLIFQRITCQNTRITGMRITCLNILFAQSQLIYLNEIISYPARHLLLWIESGMQNHIYVDSTQMGFRLPDSVSHFPPIKLYGFQQRSGCQYYDIPYLRNYLQ